MDETSKERLYPRLRREPSASTVKDSLPVLFFGDLFSARVATIGINPSDREYLDAHGSELAEMARRFETLSSLDVASRNTLTDDQCERAIARMRDYFQRERTIYAWFRPLERVLRGMGRSFTTGEAVHLDLVQEATKQTWSGLPRDEAQALLACDLPFLRWQIEIFPLRVLIRNGGTALDTVTGMLGGTLTTSGSFRLITWHVGRAAVSARSIGFLARIRRSPNRPA